MSTNGQLVFTDVDKITFKGVGNTSNAVVDTVTGKIGVGIDSPDANLHVLGNSYVSTNLELGGTLIMGTVNVSAHHSLEAVTAEGNTTPLTIEFSNATTGVVTTGNVEVGGELTVSGNATVSSNLTVSGNTETKNINMLHTANTASIKLNSNVVTEFPRSKKLIKYPRVALTSDASTNSGYQGYKVSSSYFYPGYHYDWEAFDNGGDIVGWHTANGALRAYSGSGGTYAGTLQTRLASNTELGEWLQIELPDAIRLERYVITPQGSPGSWTNCPTSAVVYGSNDGTTWKEVHRYTDAISDGDASKNFPFDANSTETYNHFALVVTKRNGGANGISVQEWELYSVPEYDPDAHGTDVMVKSVPNVPNTDWLDIYYDGQDYTSMPTTVDNKTGVSTYDATPINGVGFDATQKAFTFDANSSQYLSSSTPISGNYVHTISMWFKGTNLTPTDGDTLMWIGDNTNNKRIEIYIENDRINYNFRTNDCQAHTTFINNRWYHLTCTYNGQQGSVGREIYVDGQRLSTFHTGNLADLNITNSTLNVGGFSGTSTTFMFSGFIANFRFSNRVLTSDEVWQLYAYQKEYFGHGDLSMTLKAGRLGIGTSEPRAVLDVRGDLRVDGHTQLETLAPRYYSSMQRGTFHNVSSHIITGFDHQAEGYATPALGWEVHINFNHHRTTATHVEIDGGYLSTAPSTHVSITEVATRKYDEDTSAFSFYTDRFYIGSDIAHAHAAAYAVIRITNSQVPGMQSAIHAGNSSTVRYHMLGHTMYVKPGIGSCLDVAIGKISGGNDARLHGIRVATGADNITGSYTIYTYH